MKESIALHLDYNRVAMERDDVMHKEERIQQDIKQVYKELPEVPMEVDTPIEEKVSNIDEFIQGFHLNMIELEAHAIPCTAPEEREKKEKMVNTTTKNIKSLEEEHTKL